MYAFRLLLELAILLIVGDNKSDAQLEMSKYADPIRDYLAKEGKGKNKMNAANYKEDYNLHEELYEVMSDAGRMHFIRSIYGDKLLNSASMSDSVAEKTMKDILIDFVMKTINEGLDDEPIIIGPIERDEADRVVSNALNVVIGLHDYVMRAGVPYGHGDNRQIVKPTIDALHAKGMSDAEILASLEDASEITKDYFRRWMDNVRHKLARSAAGSAAGSAVPRTIKLTSSATIPSNSSKSTADPTIKAIKSLGSLLVSSGIQTVDGLLKTTQVLKRRDGSRLIKKSLINPGYWSKFISQLVNKVISHGPISLIVNDDNTVHINIPAEQLDEKIIREFFNRLATDPNGATIRERVDANTRTFFAMPSKKTNIASASAVASKPAASASAVASKPASKPAPTDADNKEFLDAVVSGNFVKARDAMNRGANLEQKDDKGFSAVHYLGLKIPKADQIDAYKQIMRKYVMEIPEYLHGEHTDEDDPPLDNYAYADQAAIDFAETKENIPFISILIDLLKETVADPSLSHEFMYERLKMMANSSLSKADAFSKALRPATTLPDRKTLIGGGRSRKMGATRRKNPKGRHHSRKMSTARFSTERNRK